ncbi:YybH family protein [Paracoccus aerodenitrificans]|uniref:YybH family protein n=1 Tax=Paracoccus aerodenitrificans TaxID=3017781 RepID=UPI0022F0E4D7|nr:DUF4440 domain-containing protein [Paracoccus aerodenitrificans]WBU64278.1 DUF4440 domain-containing protein [Paracoccus aerodenitrificans]
MKSNTMFAAALALAPFIGTTAIAQNETAAAEERTDAQAIQAIHEEWAELIAEKDSAAIGALYAEDAVLMAQGEVAVEGADAIEDRWARQLTLDSFDFSLTPQQLVVSSSGDLAHDRGSYDFAVTLPQGEITDTGKYVLIWQKIDGDWKVIADIFNSDPAKAAE